MLLLQLHIPCGIYHTEQEVEEILAERVKRIVANERVTEQANRHYVAVWLGCARVRKIQKPVSRFAARKKIVDQITQSLHP